MSTMSDQRTKELSERFGLRNVSPGFLRQTCHFSLESIANTLSLRDLSEICSGTIPFSVSEAHSVELSEHSLVQIEDVVNIAADDPRSRGPPSTLLLRLYDGRQSFGGIERLPLGGRIGVKTTPGTKLRLSKGTVIRRGRILLSPCCIEVFGRVNAASNVWGERYEEAVSNALRAAGLRPREAVSFDALTRNANAPITNLGGISNITDSAPDDEDEQEQAFWLQAIAAVEARAAST